MSLPTDSGGGVTAQSAAFARAQLMAAQRAGILPQEFQIAKTNSNAVGQFHMLSPLIEQARHNPYASAGADSHAAVIGRIGQLGANNLVTAGDTQTFNPYHPNSFRPHFNPQVHPAMNQAPQPHPQAAPQAQASPSPQAAPGAPGPQAYPGSGQGAQNPFLAALLAAIMGGSINANSAAPAY